MADVQGTPVHTVDARAVRRARTWKVVATVALLASILAGGLILKWTREFGNNTETALLVDSQYLDFGDVWAQPDFRWTLPIRNTTGRDIRIQGFHVSCKCSSIEPESLVVPAHASADVSLTINLTGEIRSAPLGESRPTELQIAPKLEPHFARAPVWTLTGRAARPLDISPPNAYFFEPDIQENDSAPASTLRVDAAVPLAELRVGGNDYHHTIDVQHTDHRGERFEVVIQPASDYRGTEFRHVITLTGVTSSGDLLPSIRLPILGKTVPEVYAEPSTFLFGAIPVGDSRTDTVCVKTAHRIPLNVIGIESNADGTEMIAVAQRSPSESALGIRQTAVTPGLHVVEVAVLLASEGESEPVRIPFTLVYHGLESHAGTTEGEHQK